MKLNQFPRLAYNRITVFGAMLAVVSGVTIAVLLGVVFTRQEHVNPYFGIFFYTLGPPVLILGLALIPLGMIREWRRWKREGERPAEVRWPAIDLNRPAHRNILITFLAGTLIFVVISAVGSYETYHFSESVTFCGTTCHQVMEPEFVSYQHSPHARVTCTACHVGSGANWYVKSKLSGTYQVWATLRNIYPRPIPTPIESLRPAQQTCEQCHWPERMIGSQQRSFYHVMYDDQSSEWPIDMLLKTGGGDPSTGRTAGIHAHMNIGVEVRYIARDERRQEIPWVEVTDPKTGRVTVYEDSENPLSDEERASAVPRRMDCMDCHNRPSHVLNAPDEAIDEMILRGRIDRTLPAIKRLSIEAMTGDYATKEDAQRGIAGLLTDTYRKEYPEEYATRKAQVDAAITAVQEAYGRNIFPEMKAQWSSYPVNIGHFRNPGCMRCHDGNHVSDDGVVVTRDCRACHNILSQGTGDRQQVASTREGLDFEHPEDIGGMWEEVGCYECHSGVQP